MIKKKLLVVTPFFWPSIGGVQHALRLYCRFLGAEGFEILVLTSQLPSVEAADFRRNAGGAGRVRLPARETKDGFTIVRFPAGGFSEFVLGFGFAAAAKFHLPFRGALFDAWRLRGMRASAIVREAVRWKPDVVWAAPLIGPLQKLAIRIRRLTGQN